MYIYIYIVQHTVPRRRIVVTMTLPGYRLQLPSRTILVKTLMECLTACAIKCRDCMSVNTAASMSIGNKTWSCEINSNNRQNAVSLLVAQSNITYREVGPIACL